MLISILQNTNRLSLVFELWNQKKKIYLFKMNVFIVQILRLCVTYSIIQRMQLTDVLRIYNVALKALNFTRINVESKPWFYTNVII